MKLCLIITGVILVLVFLLPVREKIINFGNAVGFLLGAGFIVAGSMLEKMSFTALKWSVFTVTMTLLLLIGGCILVYREGRTKVTDESVVIVLGCKVKGSKPSLALQKRIDSAYNYLVYNPQSVAILSGGQGRDEHLSEALCMKKQLIDRGIPESRLFLEDRSTNTDENIRFSLEIIGEEDMPKRVAVATSEYHQYRALRLCRKYGLEPSPLSSHTRPDLLPTFLVREVIAVAAGLIR